LPSIRKTGCYTNDYYYKKAVATNEDVKALANKYREEDTLHYQVVQHIKDMYPDAMLHAGLGEHLTTKHAGLDAQLKGYTRGEPDITVLRKLPNGFQDVLAIELKSPSRPCKADDHQLVYHNALKNNCNIDTIVGNRFDKIIIDIHEHYKEVFAKSSMLALPAPKTDFNFSKQNNPKYWCNKLKNKSNLLIECTKRGLDEKTYQLMCNFEIARVLIEHDSGKDKLIIEM